MDLDSKFDIFRRLPNGPLWIAAVRGLEEAQEKCLSKRRILLENTSFFYEEKAS